MFARFKHLLASAAAVTLMIVIAAPAASASAPSSKPGLNADSSHSSTGFKTNATRIDPPAGFPANTPCYHEEVIEPVYETSQGALMYEFFFEANVCIFPDRIFVYDPDSALYYPNGQPDVRLASVRYTIRNTIVPIDNPSTPKDVYTYSELEVIFCPDLPRPSACQTYQHLLGLEFTPGWVYPISRFFRIA